MTTKLTIIIPCYNCSKTLRESVDSCYTQGFTNSEFEIVMVNDGSTDSTWELMDTLRNEHPNIRIYQHDKNRGGGATRNTAVANSTSEVIFCLDSDDILPENTLAVLHAYLLEKKCDAVGVHHSTKFVGTDKNTVDYIFTFSDPGKQVSRESLLQRDDIHCSLYSVFMFTRHAFTVAGGYPTEHGFDTQGFAWRFLCAGLIAYTCPDTNYLQRTQFHESYYLREYNAGRTNINWKKVMLEQSAYLSDEAYSFLKNYDERDFTRNIMSDLKNTKKVFSDEPTSRVVNIDDTAIQIPVRRNSIRGTFYRTRAKARDGLYFTYKKLQQYRSILKTHFESRESHYTLLALHLILIKKLFRIDFKVETSNKSEIIDLLLVTIAKDFPTLELVIEAAKKHLQHTIKDVYIVTKPNDQITELCTTNGYILVDERTVLGYGKERIQYNVNGLDRSGWLFQQLLKLAGDKITSTENFISICTDTILINKHSFLEDEKYIFRQNEEWHASYFSAFKKMFKYPVKTWFSYTSHMMMFNGKMLSELRNQLEEIHKKPWDQVYIGTKETNEMSCVSDYDTYANWVLCNYPNKVKNIVLYNRTLNRSDLTNLPELERRYKDKYHSVSFHSYASSI